MHSATFSSLHNQENVNHPLFAGRNSKNGKDRLKLLLQIIFFLLLCRPSEREDADCVVIYPIIRSLVRKCSSLNLRFSIARFYDGN